MKIVVVGAGPAGSSAAYFLARQGHDLIILDPKGPHEKPCGGGVPSKCLHRFPELYADFPPAGQLQDKMVFSFDNVDLCEIEMPGGMGIFSREQHDSHLLSKALQAGAIHKKSSFKGCRKEDGVWKIETDSEEMTADYLIGADGAVSRVRNQLVGKLKREAYFKAHDFLVSKKGLPLHIGFEKGLNGYLWVFPRKDNCSIGVVDYADDKSARMQSLKNYLARFDVKEEEIIRKRSALIPSLRKEDLLNHTIAGDDWALVGDAAAMVEPITGEGIYYAVYSSSLLSECLKDGREYNVEWRHAFKQIVEEAAVSRSAYRYLNKGFMKFFLRRSSLMRRLTGQHLAAYKTGRTHRAQFFMKLPLVALQSLISKPVKLN